MSQIAIRGPRVKSHWVKFHQLLLLNSFIYFYHLLGPNTTTLDYLLNKIYVKLAKKISHHLNVSVKKALIIHLDFDVTQK
jgi:hypothetical protein